MNVIYLVLIAGLVLGLIVYFVIDSLYERTVVILYGIQCTLMGFFLFFVWFVLTNNPTNEQEYLVLHLAAWFLVVVGFILSTVAFIKPKK